MIRQQKKSIKVGPLIGIVIFALIVGLLIFGIQNAGNSIRSNATEQLEEAVRNTAVHCYAIEGQYPPSIEYMEENYGLNYNHDKFFVDYQLIASNVLPDIFVISHFEGEDES